MHTVAYSDLNLWEISKDRGPSMLSRLCISTVRLYHDLGSLCDLRILRARRSSSAARLAGCAAGKTYRRFLRVGSCSARLAKNAFMRLSRVRPSSCGELRWFRSRHFSPVVVISDASTTTSRLIRCSALRLKPSIMPRRVAPTAGTTKLLLERGHIDKLAQLDVGRGVEADPTNRI